MDDMVTALLTVVVVFWFVLVSFRVVVSFVQEPVLARVFPLRLASRSRRKLSVVYPSDFAAFLFD